MTIYPKLQFRYRLFMFCVISLFSIWFLPATAIAADSATTTAFDCTTVTTIPQSECEALVTIYTTMDGPNWSKPLRPDPIFPRDTWLLVANPCEWYGVSCEAGHVQRLFFDLQGMSNSFPTESQNLTQLQTLVLVNENVLPQDNYLPALTTLHLFGATKIPASIGNLPALQEIEAAQSFITSIDPAIGELTNLQRLSLGIGELSEPIPAEFGALSALQALTLTRTSGITTPIALPANLGNLTNLSTLKIMGLVATLPDTFGNLGHLVLLDLTGNSLRTLPDTFGNLTQLRWGLLSGNQLESLPASIGNLNNLLFFDLASNQLVALPAEIGNLAQLQRLRLDSNQLQTLPTSMGALTNLTSLELDDNQLTVLPPEIGNLTKLTTLKVSKNQLTTLPETIGNLHELTGVALIDNRLTSLPSSVGQWDKIFRLELGGNDFTAYPTALNDMANLEELWFNQNNLERLPIDLVLPPKLRYFYLNQNQTLAGPIPRSFMQLTRLQTIGTRLCADDDTEFQQWLAQATDGNGSDLLACPKLLTDTTDGAPGSWFTLSGIHFGDCCTTTTVTVTVNSEVLTVFPVVDHAQFTITLTTSDTVEGTYAVSAVYGLPGSSYTYGYAPTVTIGLSRDAPLRTPTPTTTQFALPPATIYSKFIYLPLVTR